jgi:SAM-dependent methyltransferase
MEAENASRQLDAYIVHELHDMTWWSTGDIIIKCLALSNKSAVKLLDVGSGWGRVAHVLKSRLPNITYHGFELTKELYEMSKKVMNEFDNVKFVCGDIFKIDIESTFYTHAISTRVIHYFSDDQKILFLDKIHDSLVISGKIFIAIPNRYCPLRWITYKHAPLYSGKRLCNLIGAHGFRVLSYGSYNFLPPFKRYQQKQYLKNYELIMKNISIFKYAGGLWYVTAEKR